MRLEVVAVSRRPPKRVVNGNGGWRERRHAGEGESGRNKANSGK